MGEGNHKEGVTTTNHLPNVHIQEKGEIFFFYRPKVEKQEAHGSQDVQRLYIVLRPEELPSDRDTNITTQQSGHHNTHHTGLSTSKRRKIDHNKIDAPTHQTITQHQHAHDQEVNMEKQMLIRLMVMGRKSLPDIPHSPKKERTGRRPPYWGFVEMVTTNIDDLKNALKGGEYDTSTRGHRHTPPARALGEGIYHILRHTNPGGKNKKTHTHLIYKLRFPHKGEKHEKSEEEGGSLSLSPQESLNIEHEASYLIQIKNPSAGGGGSSNFRGLESKRRANFPTHLEEKFGKLRFSPADPTDFLNYEGCEFLLIAASDDISEELGLELESEEYEISDEEGEPASSEASCSDLLKTFGSSNSALSSSIAPLLKGTWA